MGTMKNNLTRTVIMGVAMAGLISSTGALAALTVDCDGDCTSATTGGRWDQNFGNDVNNCLYLLGTNHVREDEATIPNRLIEETDPDSCLGGLDSPNLVGMNYVDVRVFSGAGDDETVAYSWTYDKGDVKDTSPADSPSQFIPSGCDVNGDFDSTNPNVRNGGFDNGDLNPARPVVDPLSLEFALGDDVKGNAVLSYYFMNGKVECRDQSWELFVNDSVTPVKSGEISDFAEGKYLVFDVNGLNGGDTFRLDINPGEPTTACTTDPQTNRTVSGLFISGTSVCGYCGDGYYDPDTEACDSTHTGSPNADICNEACGYCGDGVFDPDYEQCDGSDAASPNADSCNDVCEIIVQGGEGCTPGFYKNLEKHLNAWGGINPDDLFHDWFDDAFPGKDLEFVLRQGGGGKKALGRHVVAALLNANNGDVAYGMTVMQVQDAFNDLYPASGDNKKAQYNALKNIFRDANESGCPINGKGEYEFEFD